MSRKGEYTKVAQMTVKGRERSWDYVKGDENPETEKKISGSMGETGIYWDLDTDTTPVRLSTTFECRKEIRFPLQYYVPFPYGGGHRRRDLQTG